LVAFALKDASAGGAGGEDDFVRRVGAGGVGAFFKPIEAGDGEPSGVAFEAGFILGTPSIHLVSEGIGGDEGEGEEKKAADAHGT